MSILKENYLQRFFYILLETKFRINTSILLNLQYNLKNIKNI